VTRPEAVLRSDFAGDSLAVAVEPLSRFAAERAFGDERREPVRDVELEAGGDLGRDVEPDEVEERERPHGMAGAQAHARVDMPGPNASSTSSMRATGWNTSSPNRRSGRSLASASSRIDRDEVVLASNVSDGRACPSIASSPLLASRSSAMA
jgi:hypothetical protein